MLHFYVNYSVLSCVPHVLTYTARVSRPGCEATDGARPGDSARPAEARLLRDDTADRGVPRSDARLRPVPGRRRRREEAGRDRLRLEDKVTRQGSEPLACIATVERRLGLGHGRARPVSLDPSALGRVSSLKVGLCCGRADDTGEPVRQVADCR